MSKNKDISGDDKKGDLFGSSFGSSDSKLPNSFDEIFGRLKLVFGVETDTDFARCMGFKQGSVSGAKQKKAIPPAWITEVALSKGVSADWLLTGEGEMRRDGGTRFANVSQTRELMAGRAPETRRTQWSDAAPTEPATPQASIYNDSPRKDVSIADLLAKTARVLESNTVYREALHSNIEAFHHGVVLDERVNKMEEQFGQALAALQEQLREIQAENKTIRHELEESRAASAIRDTG